jgi:hypothetical protein
MEGWLNYSDSFTEQSASIFRIRSELAVKSLALKMECTNCYSFLLFF